MSSSPTGYRAVYSPHPEKRSSIVFRPVISWGADGDALVVDQQAGCLVAANSLPRFERLDRVDFPVVGALPPGDWRVAYAMGDGQPELVETLIGWAVHADGHLTPVMPGEFGQGEPTYTTGADEARFIPPRPAAEAPLSGPEGWLALKMSPEGAEGPGAAGQQV